MNKSYVYILLDPRKPGKYTYGDYSFKYEPFYIGKSSEKYNRFKDHLRESKSGKTFKSYKIRNIKKETSEDPIFIKIEDIISEKESFDLETELIKLIGRYDLNKGPLTNLTNGGEGNNGYVHTEKDIRKWKETINNRSKKEKQKTKKEMSESHKGQIAWNKGKKTGPQTEECIRNRVEKIKGKRLGIPLSEQHKKKLKGPRPNVIPWNKGLKTGPLSKEHKEKLRGRVPWNKRNTS